MSNAGRALALSELRERIERLEHGLRRRAVLPFRVREVDRHLPAGGLVLGALNEVMQAGGGNAGGLAELHRLDFTGRDQFV